MNILYPPTIDYDQLHPIVEASFDSLRDLFPIVMQSGNTGGRSRDQYIIEEEDEDDYKYGVLSVGKEILVGSLTTAGVTISAIFGDFYTEFLLGLGMVAIANSIMFVIASVIGMIYLVAWILEEAGVVEENYIDTVLNVFFE